MKSDVTKRSRYRRLPLVLFALIIVAAVTGTVVLRTVKDRLIAATGEGLALAASDISDKLDLFLFERYGDIQALASVAQMQSSNLSQLNGHLARMQKAYPVYQWIGATDESGKLVAATDPGRIGQDESKSDWFGDVRGSHAVVVQDVGLSSEPMSGKATLFAAPVLDENHQFRGAVVAMSGLPAMGSLFEETAGTLQSLRGANWTVNWRILNHEGRILHDSSPQQMPNANLIKVGQLSAMAACAGGRGWIAEQDQSEGIPVVTGYAPTRGRQNFKGLGWAVLVRLERSEVLASMHRVLWIIGLTGAAIVIPLLSVLVWSLHRLRTDWSRLLASEAHLSTTLHSIAEGVITTDADGRITILNGVAENLTGWKEADARGRNYEEVVTVIEKDTREKAESLPLFVLREGKSIVSRERTVVVSRDGTERIVAQAAAPIPGERGRLAGVAIVCRDITERELSEAALRASQETFRVITDNMSDVITLHDLDGRVVFQTPSRTESRLVMVDHQGRIANPFDHIIPEDRKAVHDTFTRIITTGESQRAEYRMGTTDGSILVVESVGTLIRGTDGQPSKILGVSRDVTQRRRVEERLRREKEFNDSILASLPGIFFVCASDRKMLRWNRNFEVVVGCSTAEITELDLLAFFPQQEQDLVETRMDRCFREGKTDIETVLWHRNGRLTAHYISGLRFEYEQRPAMLGVGIDITARKSAEEALLTTSKRIERQNAALAEQAHNPALLGDRLDLAYNAITEVAARTLGVCRASIWFYESAYEGIRCEDLFDHPSGSHRAGLILKKQDYPHYFDALAEGRVIPAHYARTDPRTRDFVEHYLKPLGITSMLDAPIRLEGRMIGVVCHEHTGSPREWSLDEQNFAGSMADLVALSLEVWQRRQAERAVREARDQLEVKVAERTRELSEANAQLKQLDRLKSEFLAMMSHELRTPLNSIIGFTGILRDGLTGPLNDEQKKQLGMVNFSAKHLLALINDLLDLSRIESGKMDVYPEKFDVAAVVNDVATSLGPAASAKHLEVETALPTPTIQLHTDRKRTFQILLNLANNAVKFTERGRVRITVHGDAENVQFEVSDTGIGITAEQLTNLFQAFRQVDGSARRVYEGTGLGLYLSKKLVTMLGGTIGVESQFGVGSKFHFQLPRELKKSAS